MDILQHEYGITNDPHEELVTRGITICTAQYGWDLYSNTAFLSHFDHPFSVFSIQRILKDIQANIHDIHHLDSHLVGGKQYFWSFITRMLIKFFVKRQRYLNISIQSGKYDNWPTRSRCVTVSSVPRRASFENKQGPVHRVGILWFLGHMKKSHGSA